MSTAALMWLLPDFAMEPRRRELESEEQKPLFSPGSDPAAERGESNYYTAKHKCCYGRHGDDSLELQQREKRQMGGWGRLACSGRSPAGPGKRRVLGWSQPDRGLLRGSLLEADTSWTRRLVSTGVWRRWWGLTVVEDREGAGEGLS